MANRIVRSERKPWNPVSEDAVPGPQGPLTSGRRNLPGTTNVDPVYLGYAAPTTPYGSPRPVYSNVYQQREDLRGLRAEAKKDPVARAQYNSVITGLRRSGYLGPRSKATPTNVDRAWSELLKDNASAATSTYAASPSELLFGGQPGDMEGAGGGRSGRGGAGGYSGPFESVVRQSETDIVAIAQSAAQALLGRAPTDKELEKIMRQTRKAETAQPQVTRREGPGRTVTEEGLTKEGRDAIVKRVLMSSPDYASYQFDSTFLDMMLNNLQRGQEVARGTF